MVVIPAAEDRREDVVRRLMNFITQAITGAKNEQYRLLV